MQWPGLNIYAYSPEREMRASAADRLSIADGARRLGRALWSS